MSLTLVTAMRSVTGPHRPSNQDSVGCSDGVAFVADGVGGHVGGEVASGTVTHRLMSVLASRDVRTVEPEQLRELIGLANADLAVRARREPELAGMATTFTGLFCGDRTVRVAHIGDSRAYLVRHGEGWRVTRDDSLVQMLVDQGAIGAAEAEHHPRRNVIVRSLSGAVDDAADVTLLTLPAEPGDRWLLASDGLTDYVPESVIVGHLLEQPPEAAADRLVQAALDADSMDNITVAVCDVVARDDRPDTARPTSAYGGAAADAQERRPG